MGKTTDELVSLASALNGNPPAREMDRLLSTGEQVSMALLAMALEARGYRAMSFTGRQAGIETDTSHLKSKITGIDAKRIMDAVDAGIIPVIAGFQGIDGNGDITTLGRGGSDTTAVAVAWGIGADVCEMEGAAMAQVAYAFGVPFAVLRSVSDLADGSAPASFEKFAEESADKAAKLLLRAVEAL